MGKYYQQQRPDSPSRKLTFADAKVIWKLKREGWLQSRIAAHFDVNQGRISEVLNHKLHRGAESEMTGTTGLGDDEVPRLF